MGTTVKLTGSDGVTIDAYLAEPTGSPRGGLVILPEIFGINAHMRSVADRYAEQGYLVVAPALFDRVRPGLELDYDDEGMKLGMATMKQTVIADTLKDVQAAIDKASAAGKVGVVGYCWGGTLAYAAAAKLTGLAAAVGYYGGGIAAMLDSKPKVATMLHFGERDNGIPVASVEKIKSALPDVPVYLYPAGHAFNRDVGANYDKASADLALSRTLSFLEEHVG